MIDELDGILLAILKDESAPPIVKGADIDFAIPRTEYENGVQDRTLNLYLYDVHENRQLRDPIPIIERIGDTYVKRPPPLRVDCSYMVTAWSIKQGEVMPDEEHRLLSFAMLWLSRFPTIPEAFLPDDWKDKTKAAFQPFPLLMWIAQMDGVKEPGEFWAALGSPPRPFFNLVVTIAMDLQKTIDEGPPVVTKEVHLIPDENVVSEEHWFEIGGIVTDTNTSDPIAQAQIILVEKGWKTTADADGQFRFSTLEAGTYTLNVTATGYITADKPIVVPGVVANSYDIQLST